MVLAIQAFLRTTPNGIAELKTRYAIECKRHGSYPNLCLFKYSQIDSPFSQKLVREARGIILDEANGWKVVCYSFERFFNYGEPLAADIDWNTARVQAKMDGSLMQCFHYDGKWHVATSGTPDASGQINDYGKTFQEVFCATWGKDEVKDFVLGCLNRKFCYALELVGPLNRVVVQYDKAKLYFLGCRNLDENSPAYLQESQFSDVQEYPLRSIDDCVKAAEAMVPTQNEGFVVVDANWHRVKIKSPAYVMLHHAKDVLSKRRMCEIIRKGEYEEFRTAIDTLPELKKIFDDIKAKHDNTIAEAVAIYNAHKDLPSQKEFAMAVSRLKLAPVLFPMRRTGMSPQECLASPGITPDGYMKLIGVKQ